MKLLAAILLCTSALSAVDLTGEWRHHEGDDPRWAAPDFDDSAWRTIPLPRVGRVRLDVAWMRRRVTAPLEPTGIAIGALGHCTDVYVNGRLLGGSGCAPGVNPPYFSPRVIRVPDGWLKPGESFLLALRVEGRSNTAWASTASGQVRDEGPYAIGPLDRMREAAELAHLRMERRVAIPSALLAWNSLGAGVLLISLWFRNRTRWELWWFGCFQLAIAFLNFVQLRAVYLPGASSPILGIVSTAWICLNLGTYPALYRRPLSWRMSLAIALGIPAAGQLFSMAAQLPAMLLPTYWAARRLRAARTTDRVLALGVICYSLASMNSVPSRYFPDLWPIPVALEAGSFLVSTVAATNGLLSAALVPVLVIRLGEDWQQRQRLSAEFEAARTVQRLLLRQPSLAGGWQAETVYEPASHVGGDFFQITQGTDGALMLVVGDVSGKGMEAAMMASVAVGAFRSTASDSPAEVLRVMNEALAGLGRTGFVTCCCARFGPDGRVVVSSAGHPAPYSDGQEVAVDVGLPLGIVTGTRYEESTAWGSWFTLVSDGVVEAENAQRELFGFHRTREISTERAHQIAEAARQWGQNDDITVVTVRRVQG